MKSFSQSDTDSDWEPERKIIEAAQAGDLNAVGSLYDAHINQVYRYVLARLGNVHDAEDVAEEIMYKMLAGLPGYQWRKVPFAAWLMRIARNEVVSFARRNGRRAHDTELPEDLVDHGNNDPAAATEKTMALEDLRMAVKLLPEAQREVIILRFASGLSVADTAKALGKQENNVKVLQHKGMQRLQVLMTPKYPELAQKERMSNKHIEELLQHCIAAFDAGLSPEECLSAFPDRRAELEPLFRQAISLRVAFAASPRAEFRQRTRERVLFAAGRDVSAAFEVQPDPDFVKDARQRFIRAAGAEAQEALRAVPPPRLPFWMNTRRRLLEVAAATNSKPEPVARPMGGIFAMRAGLSMAVVVLAMAVAGLAYTIGFNNPSPTNAQFAQLERDLAEIQEDKDNGLVNLEKIRDFNAKVDQIAQQTQQPAAVYEKLPDLITKQQEVIRAAASEGLLAPELAQAQNRQLEAAAAVAELRLAAARAEDPTATPVPPTNTPAITATVATPVPATSTPAPVVTPPPPGVALAEGQVRRADLGDKIQYESQNITFAVPKAWPLQGGIEFEDGFVQLDISALQFRIDSETGLLVDIETGQIQVFQGTTQFTIRTRGLRGEFISNDDLIVKAGALVGDLRAVRDSVELSGALVPTPTATPSATPTTTLTPSPTVTNTPAPATTP